MADPDRIVLYAAVAATSGGALLVGALALGLRWAGLARAAGLVLEAIGLAVVFFAANIVAGTAFIIGMRLVVGVFISVYAMDDLVLLVLSAGQALVFQAWRLVGWGGLEGGLSRGAIRPGEPRPRSLSAESIASRPRQRERGGTPCTLSGSSPPSLSSSSVSPRSRPR